MKFWLTISVVALAGMMFCVVMRGNTLSAAGRPSLSTSIRVWHDDARGVTCYVAEGREDNASIHCLPDSQLGKRP